MMRRGPGEDSEGDGNGGESYSDDESASTHRRAEAVQACGQLCWAMTAVLVLVWASNLVQLMTTQDVMDRLELVMREQMRPRTGDSTRTPLTQSQYDFVMAGFRNEFGVEPPPLSFDDFQARRAAAAATSGDGGDRPKLGFMTAPAVLSDSTPMVDVPVVPPSRHGSGTTGTSGTSTGARLNSRSGSTPSITPPAPAPAPAPAQARGVSESASRAGNMVVPLVIDGVRHEMTLNATAPVSDIVAFTCRSLRHRYASGWCWERRA